MNNTDNVFGYALFTSCGAFCAYIGLEPIVAAILAGAFVLDFLTGLLKAKKQGIYRSKIGWVKTVAKVLGMFLIGLVGMVFKALGIAHEYFVMASLMGLALHDMISSARNIYVVRTGEDLPEMDVVSMVIKKIHNQLVALVKKLFGEK